MSEKEIGVDYNFGGNAVKNIADPVDAKDAANKEFVLSAIPISEFTFAQSIPNASWGPIAHNLGKLYPNILVKDSADTTIIGGELEPIDSDNCRIVFSAAFGGIAYLS